MADEEEQQPASTQVNGHSVRTYLWCIFFHFDVNDEFPFTSVPLDQLKGSDFPFQLITGHLGLENRIQPRNFSKLPGHKYCLFAKVESGTALFSFF